MSKANKAGTATATRKGPQAAPASHRFNLRGAIILMVAVPTTAAGFFVLKHFSAQKSRSSYLGEARKALDDKRPDMAYTYVTNYLRSDPDNLEALELQSRIYADQVRDYRGLEEAIRVHTRILSLDPARMEARKRLVILNLKGGPQLARAAQGAAEEYLNRGADDAEAHRLMAQALEAVGRLGDIPALDGSIDPKNNNKPPPYNAIAEYEKAEKLKPGDVDGGFRLAELYLARGRAPARAVEVMDKMLEASPKSVAARLARLRFFLRHPELTGDSAEAARAKEAKVPLPEYQLAEALKIAPGDPDARMLAAESAVAKGDTAAARKHLDAIDPPLKDNLAKKLIEGMIEFREQRPDEGIQSWRAGLIQTGGTDAQLTWRLARVLINLGRVGEAQPLMAQYRRLAGGTEPNAEYRYLEALVNLRAGRVAEALKALESMRDKLAGSLLLTPALHLTTLGDAYAAARDEARAIDTYTEAARMAGAGSQPWMAIARLHQVADRPAEAITAMENGLAAVPGDAGLLVALAQGLRQRELVKPKERREWGEFEKRLAQAEQAAGDTAEVALLRADYLADRGQLEDALKRIEAAVSRAPKSVGPWVARVNALTRLGRPEEALAALDEAAKKAGDNAVFRVARARLLLRRGEPRAAFEALAGGLEAVPADQRSLLHRSLGEFHQGRNDFRAARTEYDEWARLQPESVEPRLALLNLASSQQDGPGMEAQAEAIRKVVGPGAVVGKVARAEVLLNLKPRSGDGRSGEDKARLDEVEKLVAEIKAAAPRQVSGFLLEARLMGRLGRVDEEIAAYRAALDLRGGQIALKPLVVLLVKGRRDAELAEVRQKVASFPMEVDQIASSLMLQQGDAARAEELVDQMMLGNPEGFDAAVWKVKILNTMGKPGEAEEVLRMLTLSQPRNPSTWVSLLMFQASRGEMQQARATLEKMKASKGLDSNRKELLWAACYRALNMRPEADEAFAAALKLWPDDPGVSQVAIDYYETTGRPELAETALRHLLSIRPGFDWARRRLALNLSARQNNPTALSEALGLLGAPGGAESPEDRQLRAIILSRSADPKHRAEAIGILEALTAEVVNPAKLHEALARSLLASGEQARAVGDGATAAADRARGLDHAAKAAAGESAPADVILFNAVLRLQEKDIPGARAGLARIEKTDPKALPTVELRARILHAEGKDPEAEALIRATFEARKASPDALTSGVGLLKLLIALNRPAAAEGLGAELAKVNARGRIAFAEFLAGRGKAKEAREQLDLAGKAGAADEAARSSLALANDLGGGWVDQAEQLLDLALKGRPESIDLMQAQAFLRHIQRDYSAEIETYKGILAKNPSNLLFLNNMAWTLSEELNQPKEGFAEVERAIAKVGRQSHLVDTRGVILLRLGRVPEAIKDIEDAAGMLPTGPIYYHLARAYKAAGREADSEKYRDLARKAGLRAEQLQPSERDEAAKLVGFPAAKPADRPPAEPDKPAAEAKKP